ncbi:MAG: hypothetical protein A2134_02940 [Candidatus Woykebacteria bacterium RBG_16_39_9b]|uniref:Lycopene cyclase domain-containing protein n=1 Tax=Candidatus Woykebacteria bacterium RBG_16_39_9b TaxID=1802595 RepID=A0A1G1WEF1_9BACT|nr:MAG: hypothetical protein A2134_02940 [Candidatus Woykebacteria bacterium RBG_16_39_9b]
MPNYTYLLGSLLLISFWLILFLFRKDLRREMLVISTVVLFSGMILQYFFWTKDWWHPETMTGTILGPEDFLGLFGIGGISSVIYGTIFSKGLSFYKHQPNISIRNIALLAFIFIALHSIAYYIFGLSSWMSWTIATTITTLFIYSLRSDLIFNSLVSGVLMVLIGIAGYQLLNFFQPGFIYSWFKLENLSGFIIIGVPIEDVAWFMTFGMFIGPIYEFLTEARSKPIN